MYAINEYQKQGIGAVATKEDRQHCGFGVRRWPNVETVYNQAFCQKDWYPFVLQPFVEAYSDVRVIMAGDYCEAYCRENENNFRSNLTVGGTSKPYVLDENQMQLCRNVMKRGRFPFGHIDILVTPDGHNYLSEIALNGGMKGANIKRKHLDTMKTDILEQMAAGA